MKIRGAGVLVTGASRGIGAATATRLADRFL
jgi:NAD(P)-dependent dehydrogenase (short-subunit alcohol dehydrogenase family)